MKKLDYKGFAHSMLVMVILAILAVSGAIFYVYNKQDNKTLNSESDQSSEILPAPLPDSLLSVSQIKELVNTKKSGSHIVGVELEKEGGVLLYKITLQDDTTLFFDAQTGVTAVGNDDEKNDNKLPKDFSPEIDFDKARSIAMDSRPGANVTKIELEGQDGAVVYNIRFSDKSRIIINAKSGKIISINHPSDKSKSDEKSSISNGSSHKGSSRSDSDNSGNARQGSNED